MVMGADLLALLATVGALVVLGLVCHLLEMVRLDLLKAWRARKAARLLAQWRAEGRVGGRTLGRNGKSGNALREGRKRLACGRSIDVRIIDVRRLTRST
jgi:hypothetical protein